MIRLLLLCFLLGPVSLGLSAQDNPGEPPYTDEAKAALDHLSDLLELTEEQVPRIEATLIDYFADLLENPPDDEEEEYALEDQLRVRLAKDLTEEQLALLEEAALFPEVTEPVAETTPTSEKKKKRKWFDVLLEDIAEPIIRSRREKKEAELAEAQEEEEGQF